MPPSRRGHRVFSRTRQYTSAAANAGCSLWHTSRYVPEVWWSHLRPSIGVPYETSVKSAASPQARRGGPSRYRSSTNNPGHVALARARTGAVQGPDRAAVDRSEIQEKAEGLNPVLTS